MINKCKVEMRGGELYNVIESLREEDGKIVFGTEETEIYVRNLSLHFYLL